MSTYGLCPFCGKAKRSENGTGSDVSCCGEVGHATVIHTEHVYPPIPDRSCDWSATLADYDGGNVDYDTPSRDPIGRGPTEEMAVADLLEQLEAMA